MKTRFQNLPFKCNLQRYTAAPGQDRAAAVPERVRAQGRVRRGGLRQHVHQPEPRAAAGRQQAGRAAAAADGARRGAVQTGRQRGVPGHVHEVGLCTSC